MFLDRKISFRWFLLLIIFGILVLVFFGASVLHSVQGGKSLGKFGQLALHVASFPSLVKQIFTKELQVIDGNVVTSLQIIKNKYPELDGFKVKKSLPEGVSRDTGYILSSVFDAKMNHTKVQLIRVADQKTIYQWQPDIDELKAKENAFKPEVNYKAQNFRIQNPVLLKDGSLVFHGQQGPILFKIDGCSKVKWTAQGHFHHSVDMGSDGSFWVPTVIKPQSYPEFQEFRDDAIAHISADGKSLSKVSVTKILIDNGYRGLALASFSKDPIHVNDIQVVLSDSKYWKKGDLFMSFRHKNMIMLYRPSNEKIIWLKTGPWVQQHDVSVISDHEISVFGNDSISGQLKNDCHYLDGHSNVYIYDFKTDQVATPYKNMMEKLQVKTCGQGRSRILKGGNVFIEETASGRLMMLSKNTVEWQYVSKISAEYLAMFSWSRYLTKEEVEPILPALKESNCSKN
ncbi:MAG: arylsulfotransferase family protein [SAR324 cluster bacterium]|nr:arylsulfotransferase family protein [SAR324 cluster bacterium]